VREGAAIAGGVPATCSPLPGPLPLRRGGDRPEAEVGRRAFLRTLLVAAFAAIAGDWWRRRPAAPEFAAVAVPGAAGLRVGEALDFTVAAAGLSGVLVRLGADSFVAFDRRCPHLGCPVLWSPERARFECPCHRAVFEARSGAVVQGPPPHGLVPLAVEATSAGMWIHPRPGDAAPRRQFT
jgi:nitrite reductase/ring-hydroxylating ferredoxin subunit